MGAHSPALQSGVQQIHFGLAQGIVEEEHHSENRCKWPVGQVAGYKAGSTLVEQLVEGAVCKLVEQVVGAVCKLVVGVVCKLVEQVVAGCKPVEQVVEAGYISVEGVVVADCKLVVQAVAVDCNWFEPTVEAGCKLVVKTQTAILR